LSMRRLALSHRRCTSLIGALLKMALAAPCRHEQDERVRPPRGRTASRPCPILPTSAADHGFFCIFSQKVQSRISSYSPGSIFYQSLYPFERIVEISCLLCSFQSFRHCWRLWA
jgi:hypothetical protein